MSYRIMPVMGMDNVRPDEALQVTGDSGRLHVRDAVNVNVSEAGKVSLRNGSRHVTGTKYESLWQSPLHKDVFGVFVSASGSFFYLKKFFDIFYQ